MTTAEHHAIRQDARARIGELERAIAALLPDRDDPHVLSELSLYASQLKAARHVIRQQERDD